MTMKIGQIETDGIPGRRDAFHVPAVLVKTADKLKPCDSVRFEDSTFTTVVKSGINARHAIVDPFVKKIKPGDTFWVLLVPDLVTDLVHQFNLNVDDVPVVEEDVDVEDDDDDNPCKGCW